MRFFFFLSMLLRILICSGIQQTPCLHGINILKILSYIKIRYIIKHAVFLKEKGFSLVFIRTRIIKHELAFVFAIKITLDLLCITTPKNGNT